MAAFSNCRGVFGKVGQGKVLLLHLLYTQRTRLSATPPINMGKGHVGGFSPNVRPWGTTEEIEKQSARLGVLLIETDLSPTDPETEKRAEKVLVSTGRAKMSVPGPHEEEARLPGQSSAHLSVNTTLHPTRAQRATWT